ncbi:MAG TPA: hypothetical protein VFS84_12865 [Candidatus Binatia bacterium]|nr:hypothetical protein [Candidatus Binatia bacterium]
MMKVVQLEVGAYLAPSLMAPKRTHPDYYHFPLDGNVTRHELGSMRHSNLDTKENSAIYQLSRRHLEALQEEFSFMPSGISHFHSGVCSAR